jgi:hypothetical protein
METFRGQKLITDPGKKSEKFVTPGSQSVASNCHGLRLRAPERENERNQEKRRDQNGHR